MPSSRHIPPQHDVGAALACPRCDATQLLHRTDRLWHCVICRTLLMRTRRVASLRRQDLTSPLVPVIVAFDSWLRAQLAVAAFILIMLDVAGTAPPTALNAALGICVMLLGTSLLADGATGLRTYIVVPRIDLRAPRRILVKACFAAMFGAWVLITGGVMFHLSLRIMAVVADAPASNERQALTPRATIRADETSPPRKPLP